MANPYPPQMQPGYGQPQQPQQQPGYGQPPPGFGPPPGGPPGGPQAGPPTGQGPRPPVVRRGTSRAVPVVVSAGLAIGVFCGLLFGLGTGEEVIASPSTKPVETTESKIPVPPRIGQTPATPATTPSTPTTPSAGSGSATVAAAGTGSGSAAAPAAGSGSATVAAAGSGSGSGSGSAAVAAAGTGSGSAAPATTPPPATAKVFKVKFSIEPADVASQAKITIDGKPIDGAEAEVDVGTAAKKDIKIAVKANGYRTFEQKVTVEGDTSVPVAMTKRPAAPAGGGTVVPSGGGSGGKKGGGSGGKKGGGNGGGGGGLIDI